MDALQLYFRWITSWAGLTFRLLNRFHLTFVQTLSSHRWLRSKVTTYLSPSQPLFLRTMFYRVCEKGWEIKGGTKCITYIEVSYTGGGDYNTYITHAGTHRNGIRNPTPHQSTQSPVHFQRFGTPTTASTYCAYAYYLYTTRALIVDYLCDLWCTYGLCAMCSQMRLDESTERTITPQYISIPLHYPT